MIAILVVEDDAAKSDRINQVLLGVEGVAPNSIVRAETVADARESMKAQRFDLVVLDIALPFVSGGEPQPKAGVELLREVLGRPDHFKTPSHFVGLTGFEDIYERYGGQFATWQWTLAKYSPGRSEWADNLQSRTKHIVNAALATQVAVDTDYDWGIIAALYQPELTSLLALDLAWREEFCYGDATVYHTGKMPSAAGGLRVVACSCARMGMSAAATAAGKLTSSFRPRFLATCGIMAGVKKHCGIGDVLVSTECWDWGDGKWLLEHGVRTFHPSAHQVALDPLIREAIRPLAADPLALSEAWRDWKGPKPGQPPRIRLGQIASGAAVLADGDTIAHLIKRQRDLIGIEMELYGICVAAEEAAMPRPKVVSLKSVVDFADGEKGDSYQEYGAYISAAAFRLVAPRISGLSKAPAIGG